MTIKFYIFWKKDLGDFLTSIYKVVMASKNPSEISAKFLVNAVTINALNKVSMTNIFQPLNTKDSKMLVLMLVIWRQNLRPNLIVSVVKYIITILVIIGIGGNVSNNQVLTVTIWHLTKNSFFFLLKKIAN